MKKKALIIGCSGSGSDYLPGVKNDVANYTNFLTSEIGGGWYNSEIISLLDGSKDMIKKTVNDIKSQNNDFIFVVFSGHGDYSTAYNCRRLYTDNTNYIYESELWGLCNKELLVVDTCAGKVNDVYKTVTESIEMSKNFEAYRKDYRRVYESAISKCLDQEIYLYACDVDEFSSDTAKGGLFSKNLLEVAFQNTHEDVLSSLMAHEFASELVSRESRKKQNPQYLCNVRKGSKLPFSISK